MLKLLAIKTIQLYQKTARFRPPVCRFYPSCSEYAVQSIEKQGILKGFWSTCVRLSKCHPFHPGGYDPVD